MRTINLVNTPVDDMRDDGGQPAARRWYAGSGRATLGLLNGIPVGLVYDNGGPKRGLPTMDDMPEHDELLHGMVSCWQFCC